MQLLVTSKRSFHNNNNSLLVFSPSDEHPIFESSYPHISKRFAIATCLIKWHVKRLGYLTISLLIGFLLLLFIASSLLLCQLHCVFTMIGSRCTECLLLFISKLTIFLHYNNAILTIMISQHHMSNYRIELSNF